MDGQRLADALAYEQERRRRLANVVPMPASGQPEVAPTPSLRSNLENLSIGLGEGLTNQLEGVRALVTDPIGSAKGAYEGMVAAVRDPSIIADALRYTAQQASSGPLGAGEVIGEMVGPMRTRGTPVMQEIDVYHGSPHRFEEFDASKIGTGEGAQAYGHGIYLAESPDVARTYIPKGRDLSGFTLRETGEFIGKDDPRFPEIADTMDRMVKNGYGERFSEQFSTHSGALYTADLPDEMVDRMLDWDKPLSEQPKVLRALLNSDDEWKAYTAQLSPKSRKLAEDMAVGAKPNTGDEAFKLFKQLDADNPNADHNAIYDVIRKYNPRTTDQDWIMSMMSGSAAPGAGIRGGGGADLYNTLGGGEQAAQRLRVAGIPGMQYLDAGSRGQGGTGTRNFVVFPGEEKKVKILERDGQKISAGKGNQFPVVKAGDVVDGLKVRPETANVSSIKASLENYSVMPGIRSVSIDDFGEPGPVTGNVNKLDKRTRELADAISQSNEITPLIVVYSGSQNYILEGSHRIDALDALGKKKIPVIAVIDEDDPPAFWKGKR